MGIVHAIAGAPIGLLGGMHENLINTNRKEIVAGVVLQGRKSVLWIPSCI
jgi:hypothetical protein